MHLVLLLFAACAGDPTEYADPGIVGGWSAADPDSEGLREARDEIQALLRKKTGDDTLTIRAVTAASTQVVAGMNYKLVLDLATAEGDKNGVTAVVYRDLQQQWELTSVEGL